MEKTPRRLRKAEEKLAYLLRKANIEGEQNMHIIVSHYPIDVNSDDSFYGDNVSINVRYFHGREKREVTAYRVYSKSRHYNPALRVREVAEKIEKSGLVVRSIRGL
jgi:hypothetical protein